MTIKYKAKFNIIGRGDVYTMSCKENGLSTESGGLDGLMGSTVIIDEKEFLVKGIEAMGQGTSINDMIGLLVKQK